MRTRQPRLLAHLLNAETLRSVGAHKFREAADWHTTCARDELQQARTLLIVRIAHELFMWEKQKITHVYVIYMVVTYTTTNRLHTCQNHMTCLELRL